jgi:hypothetical protein
MQYVCKQLLNVKSAWGTSYPTFKYYNRASDSTCQSHKGCLKGGWIKLVLVKSFDSNTEFE